MANGSQSGDRLSREEYVSRVQALHAQASAGARPEADLVRAEFDLRVDHRLGRTFPPARREALWQAHQRMKGGRLVALLKGSLRSLLRRAGDDASAELASLLRRSYGEVLSPEELDRFLGEAG